MTKFHGTEHNMYWTLLNDIWSSMFFLPRTIWYFLWCHVDSSGGYFFIWYYVHRTQFHGGLYFVLHHEFRVCIF